MAMLNSQRVNQQMVKLGEVLWDVARGFTKCFVWNVVPQNPLVKKDTVFFPY